jgi:hypothetical protein
MIVRRDLNRSGETQQVDRLNLRPEVGHFNFIQRYIHRIWGGTKAKVSLIYIECILPPNLKVNKEKLFYLEVGGKRHYSRLSSFEMDSSGNDIPIGIDLSQIEDVNELLDEFIVGKNVLLKYKLLFRNEKNSIHFLDEGELELEITPLHCRSCELGETNALRGTGEDDKIPIEHNISKSREKLWELVFNHPGHLQFSNPVSSKILLRIEEDGKTIKDKFFLEGEFGNGTEYNTLIIR